MRYTVKKLSNYCHRVGLVLSMALVLLMPQMAYSQTIEEDPSALAMAGDSIEQLRLQNGTKSERIIALLL